MPRLFSVVAVVLLALVTVGTVACAPSTAPTPASGEASKSESGDDPELAQLYDAARQEGQVVVIGPSAGDMEGVFAAFEQKYPGIKVDALTARGPEMIARLDSEITSGQRQISVFATALSTMYTTHKAERFEQWDPPSAKGLSERFRGPENSFNAASATPYGILINTDLVSPDQAPRTWKDLADPKWRGKIFADDPRTAGGGQIVMVGFIHHPELGWPFVEALQAQQIQFTRERPQLPTAVARGEYPIAMPVSVRDYIKLQEAKAPVQLILPEIGACECATGYVGVLAGAPHPNAAKLLVNFFFMEEGQKKLAERGDFPALPGMDGPAGYPSLDKIPLLPQLTTADVDTISDYVNRFESLFFRQ